MSAYSERKNERRGKQLKRLLALIGFLQSGSKTIEEIAERFDISERTARRDLKVLIEIERVQSKQAFGKTHFEWIKQKV